MAVHEPVHQSLVVTVAPTTEPVTLDEAKSWMKLDDVPASDAAVNGAIAAARNTIEQWLRRQLLTATYELSLDAFPTVRDNVIRLEMGPVQSIVSISYKDVDDNLAIMILDDVSQDLKTDPARLRPKQGNTWPATRNDLNVVTIEYVTGYGVVADIPGSILTALRMLITDLYAHPSAQAEMKLMDNATYERLLWPHRALRVG